MGRKIGYAIMAAAIAFAVLRFGAGTVAFKPGLAVEALTTNAHSLGLIGAVIVGGLVLAYASPASMTTPGPERRVGISLICAAVTYAVLRFGAGTVAFKPGLEVEQLVANAQALGLIGAAIVGGLVLAMLSPAPPMGAGSKKTSEAPSLRELEARRRSQTSAQLQRR